jgi:hypothetical protein
MTISQISPRQLLSLAMIMLVMVCTAGQSPAFGEDILAKSNLIRGLLPTVLSISVRKQEQATPASTVATTVAADD